MYYKHVDGADYTASWVTVYADGLKQDVSVFDGGIVYTEDEDVGEALVMDHGGFEQVDEDELDITSSDVEASAVETVDVEAEESEAEECETVKSDGEVCGRELPCPYHGDE